MIFVSKEGKGKQKKKLKKIMGEIFSNLMNTKQRFKKLSEAQAVELANFSYATAYISKDKLGKLDSSIEHFTAVSVG